MPETRPAPSESDAQRELDTVLRLIKKCRLAALQISVSDVEGRDELLDALSVAEISVLRLMAEEGVGRTFDPAD